MNSKNSKLNGSGCKDLTAHAAIKSVSKEEYEQEKKVYELIKVLKFIINACGFDLVSRISIVDRKTRKEYR